jgi:hypothetical protein
MNKNIQAYLSAPTKAEYPENYFSESVDKMAKLRQVWEEMQGDILHTSFPQ